MKPLNLDNRPCSPISSNCVIWQGPDIPCIKLCSGDTISDIVFKLATELCTIMDQLNVSNYDLSCFNLTACPPEDFQALIQFLITKICELNGISPDDPKSSGCPDCVVSVATCLRDTDPTLPSTIQLIDYVQLIATKLCAIISEIDSINEQISVINFTLVDLQFQIDNLPVYELPKIEMDCILSGQQPLDAAVDALINNALGYCALLNSTGTPTEINTAVLTQCIADIDQPLAALALTPPVISTFSAYYSGSWVNSASLGSDPTLANAVNNIWIAICDMYTYVSNIPRTVVAAGTGTTVTSSTVSNTTTYTVSVAASVPTVQDTNTINLTNTSGTLSASMQDTGWKDLLGFSYMSGAAFRPQCRRIGNIIYFKGTIYVPIGTLNNGGGGTPVTVVNPQDYNDVYRGFTFNTLQAAGSHPDACLLYTSNYAPWTLPVSPSVTPIEALRLDFGRGNSVIPSGILGVGETLDAGATVSGRVICERAARSTDEDNIAMTSVIGLSISAAGVLVLTSANFNDIFQSPYVGKTALTRQLCTTAIAGENIPEYYGTAPSQFNATAAGSYAPNLVGSAQTFAFNQDMSRAEQLAGLAINVSDIKAFVKDCPGNIPTFISCVTPP